jgi:hypothetical protein
VFYRADLGGAILKGGGVGCVAHVVADRLYPLAVRQEDYARVGGRGAKDHLYLFTGVQAHAFQLYIFFYRPLVKQFCSPFPTGFNL